MHRKVKVHDRQALVARTPASIITCLFGLYLTVTANQHTHFNASKSSFSCGIAYYMYLSRHIYIRRSVLLFIFRPYIIMWLLRHRLALVKTLRVLNYPFDCP